MSRRIYTKSSSKTVVFGQASMNFISHVTLAQFGNFNFSSLSLSSLSQYRAINPMFPISQPVCKSAAVQGRLHFTIT
jgi:hypothetical protein